MMSFGSVTTARDRDALTLTAGEFVRTAIARAVRIEPDGVEHLVDLGALLGLAGLAPDRESFADDVTDLAPGIERRDGILEDHLHARPHAPQRLALQLRELLAGKAHASRRGPRELHHRSPGRRLAAPRLTHETDRFAFEDVKAHVGDRVHLAAARGELDDEMLDAKQRLLIIAKVRGAAPGHAQLPCPGDESVAATAVGSAVAAVAALAPSAASRSLRSSAAWPCGVPTGNQQRNS